MSFCYFCGKKELEEPSGRFNPDTGEPIMSQRCEDNCQHGFHYVQETPSRFWHIFTGYRGRCKHCGKKLYHEEF